MHERLFRQLETTARPTPIAEEGRYRRARDSRSTFQKLSFSKLRVRSLLNGQGRERRDDLAWKDIFWYLQSHALMFKMLIDTCVWLDLAKDPKQLPVLGVVEELVKLRKISLIVPRIVIVEFQRTANA